MKGKPDKTFQLYIIIALCCIKGYIHSPQLSAKMKHIIEGSPNLCGRYVKIT